MRLVAFTLLSAIILPAASRLALPPTFERNVGQAALSVEWIVRSGSGAAMYLKSTGAAIAQPSKDGSRFAQMHFVGARAATGSVGEQPLESYSNYYFGRDSKHWYTGVPHFARVRYRDVYPGIDIVYRTHDGAVEYDFEVKPGADPSRIHLSFDGIDRLQMNSQGDLVLTSSGNRTLLRRPKVVQAGSEISARYYIGRANRVEIALAVYDHKRPLLIDPVIQFASYLGGPGGDSAAAIRTDSRGFFYIAGVSQSQVSPTLDPFQQSGFIVVSPYIFKMSPDGQHLVFFLSLVVDNKTAATDLAIDGDGNLLLVGETTALQLPLVNPIDSEFKAQAQTAYAAKWSADGRSLIYSTYFGGSGNEHTVGAAVDAAGNLFLAGVTTSPDLPVANALQPVFGGGDGASVSLFGYLPIGVTHGPVDCFVTKLSPVGSLLFATYLGGDGDDNCNSIAATPEGDLVIAGNSEGHFPLVNPIQTVAKNCLVLGGQCIPFSGVVTPVVAKLQGDGQALLFSTYFGGGTNGSLTAVAVDGSGNILLGGFAGSALTTKNAYQPTGSAGSTFVASLDSTGQTILYSTYLDGSAGNTSISQIATGADGSPYVTGATYKPDFPAKNLLQDFQGDLTTRRPDVFLARLAPSGSSLVFSTFLGGNLYNLPPHIAIGSDGTIFYAATTLSTNIATLNAFQPLSGGSTDIVFMKIQDDSALTTAAYTLSPGTLAFQAVQGALAPVPQLVTVQGPSFTATPDAAWLAASPAPDDPNKLSISVDASALDPGRYRGTVALNNDVGDAASISVTLQVLSPAPLLDSVSPSRIPVGSPDTELTFRGSGFTADSVVLSNGTPFPGAPVVDDSGTLRLTLPQSYLKSLAIYFFSVVNPQSAASGLRAVQVQ